MKKAILFISFICYLFVVPVKVEAIKEFKTSYYSTYQIDEKGATTVTHEINIQNNLANIFPKEYSLAIGSLSLQNVNLYVNNTALTPDITKSENATTIHFSIPNPAIGKDQSTHITISYSSLDHATHLGNVWEINIPRLNHSNEMDSVTRRVIFPSHIGSPTSAVPSPDQLTTENNDTILTYTTNRDDAISLLFGEAQTYALTLKYQIQNQGLSDQMTEIALPPDTPYQKVAILELIPRPTTLVVDQDGNWLARYYLKNQTQLDIAAKLLIKVSPKPIYPDPSSLDIAELTRKQNYWEIDSPALSQIASQLKSPQNVYNYLIEHFTYNSSRIGLGATRLGAVGALSAPTQALCTEFTDSFIALVRKNNIPAREINGYAITNNSALRPLSLDNDVLHAWPEYYDQATKIWTQIDPTWGNTTGGVDYFHKLDYGHITFVRHGKESDYPYPVGVYKQSSTEKSIHVEQSNLIFPNDPKWQLDNSVNPPIIKNEGQIAIVNRAIPLPDGTLYTISYLPPYASETLKIQGVATQRLSWLSYLGISGLAATILLSLFLWFRFRKEKVLP